MKSKLLVVLASAGALLAACGSKSSEPASVSATPASIPPAVAPGSAAPAAWTQPHDPRLRATGG
jgi:hypothetical protein